MKLRWIDIYYYFGGMLHVRAETLEQRMKRPGIEVDIDEGIEEELRGNIQQDLTFFGGHPKSL